MPLFLHKRDPESGRTIMEQVEVEYSGKKFEIKTPNVTPAKVVRVWECTACEPGPEPVKFRSAGVAALHFRKNHPELNERKESWKDYFEVRNESHSQ